MPFDESFREYKVFVPYEKFKKVKKVEIDLKVVPMIDSLDQPFILKPEIKDIKLSRIEPELTNNVHFKVIKGMFIEGKTTPSVPTATVTI